MEPVAAVGWAQTRHEARKTSQNYAELVYEVVERLLTDLGLKRADLDTMISASSDFSDGRTISNMAIQDVIGAPFKSESKVSMDGAFALIYGYASVASGAFETALVVSHAKASEGRPRLIANAAWDPVYLRPLGLDDHSALGLQAAAYLSQYGLREEDLSESAAWSFAQAAANPFAHRREGFGLRAVQASDRVSDPLRRLHIAPDSDGACAILLASPRRARELCEKPIWLRGVGSCYDAHSPGQRELARSTALEKAVREACGRAGIKRPDEEIAAVEVTDLSSCQTVMWPESLGFCQPGRGRAWLQLDERPEYNRSGGSMGAHPGFAAGLVRVAEVAAQIRDRATRERGDRPLFGLAHGMTGAIGQAHCVWILST